MEYIVYILYSKNLDVYYKGSSIDVDKRLIEHLEGNSNFTSKVNDWKIVFKKNFETKREALIEEKRLKKLNRVSIEKLLNGYNVALSSRPKRRDGFESRPDRKI